MLFYILVTVISVAAFTADMILRYMEKIPSFGSQERFFNIKGKNIPIEELIPNNITMLTVFGISLGTLGILSKLAGVTPLVAFPCCVMFGCLVNFAVVHFLKPFYEDISGTSLSERDDISGLEAVCTEDITADSYGRVELVYKERKYEFDALSANGTDIAKGEKTFILYRKEGLCFVEAQSEVLDIINEDIEEMKARREARGTDEKT